MPMMMTPPAVPVMVMMVLGIGRHSKERHGRDGDQGKQQAANLHGQISFLA